MSRTPPPDPYAVLGVPRTASAADIVHAYRRRLRATHPDTRRPDPSADPAGDPDAVLQHTLAAYAILRDPDRRAAYDRQHPVPRRTDPRRVAHPAQEPPIRAGPVYWMPP